jgi:hypothetical protein
MDVARRTGGRPPVPPTPASVHDVAVRGVAEDMDADEVRNLEVDPGLLDAVVSGP